MTQQRLAPKPFSDRAAEPRDSKLKPAVAE